MSGKSEATPPSFSDRAEAASVLRCWITKLRHSQSFGRDDTAAKFEAEEIAPLIRVAEWLDRKEADDGQ